MNTIYNGIDVSEHQQTIDWQRVRDSGVRFAMLRCGYGRYAEQRDDRFEENYSRAKEAGLDVGAYLFSYALTEQQAREEAHNCLTLLGGRQFGYPIAYDVETSAHAKLGREKLSAVVTAFAQVLEENGYYVALYSNLQFLQQSLTQEVRQRYDIWLAQWTDRPTYTGTFGMWQYTASGRVDGINGNVDLDLAYKDYPAIMRRNGLNGFPKPVQTAARDAAPSDTRRGRIAQRLRRLLRLPAR